MPSITPKKLLQQILDFDKIDKKITKKLVQQIQKFDTMDKEIIKNLFDEPDEDPGEDTDEDPDEYPDEDPDETSVDDTDEFQYDLGEIKNPTNNLCLKCKKKFINRHNLAVCISCMKSMSITKTNAMKIYNLKSEELDDIDCYPERNCYHGYTHWYLTKEIRLLTILIRFGSANPSLYEYNNCVQIIMEDAAEREKQSKARGLKMIEARERNKQQKIHEEQLAYEKRKAKLLKKLKKEKLVLDKGCNACDKYLNNKITDLESVIKQAKKYSKRKSRLKRELAKKDLVIRHDSYYCQQYLKGKQFTVGEVVEMMEMMDFFVRKTEYFKLTKEYLQSQYDDAKEYGYWDGERITLCEEEKDEVKVRALKKYLEKNTIGNVPQSVLDRYHTCDKSKKKYHTK